MNLLRALAPQAEEGHDESKEESQDELMDFEQELLDMDDSAKEDDTPALIPPPEIRVNSEHLVDRVSDVVVLKMKRELRRQAQASEALLSRMEQKLDLLLQQDPPTRSETKSTSKEIKACYFCREEGHLASKCKARVKCKGCGDDRHPYDRCEDRATTCTKCGVVGHSSAVHQTKDPGLRKSLYDAHPDEFSHFFSVEGRAEPAQNRLHRGSAKRRNSWEDGSVRSERSSKSRSRNREPRDKYPRSDLGKGRGSRRSV